MTVTRRAALSKIAVSGTAAAAAGLAAPALASQSVTWKMVTSWPANLPGPGVSAARIADDINSLSGGRLKIELYPAGEIVPAFGVFDAVENGAAEMAHTASFFWQGKYPAAALFTAAPFGLTPLEHITWIEQAGGQDIWTGLYADAGVLPFMAGNTGFQMGGWYVNPIRTADDFRGLKIRMPGLGGEVVKALGATPVSLPPSEILTGLTSGTIDAAEFLGPSGDLAMGFHKVAKNYYWPGFHEPNGTGEALISRRAFEALSPDLQKLVTTVLRSENARGLAEGDWLNAVRLPALIHDHGVTLQRFPDDVLDKARNASEDVLSALAAKDPVSGKAVASFRAARKTLSDWSRVSVGEFLTNRGQV